MNRTNLYYLKPDIKKYYDNADKSFILKKLIMKGSDYMKKFEVISSAFDESDNCIRVLFRSNMNKHSLLDHCKILLNINNILYDNNLQYKDIVKLNKKYCMEYIDANYTDKGLYIFEMYMNSKIEDSDIKISLISLEDESELISNIDSQNKYNSYVDNDTNDVYFAVNETCFINLDTLKVLVRDFKQI